MVSHFPADPLAPAAVELSLRHASARTGRRPARGGASMEARFHLRHRLSPRSPLTVHPGVGYDIVSCHPMFNGAAIGRAAEIDFKQFAGCRRSTRPRRGAQHRLGHHGPAGLLKPQLRPQPAPSGWPPHVSGHSIYVVDLQDGGGWDWTRGEPPKSNAAYYLRFCKSYSAWAAPCDTCRPINAAFVHALWKSPARPIAQAAGVRRPHRNRPPAAVLTPSGLAAHGLRHGHRFSDRARLVDGLLILALGRGVVHPAAPGLHMHPPVLHHRCGTNGDATIQVPAETGSSRHTPRTDHARSAQIPR